MCSMHLFGNGTVALQQYFSVLKFPEVLLLPFRQLVVSLMKVCDNKYIFISSHKRIRQCDILEK